MAKNNNLLDPKLDIVFKMLFADINNKNLLISLLTAVIKPRFPIVSVDILNPEIPKDYLDEKGIILDIHVKLADNSLIDVEMQTSDLHNIRKRALYYWAKTYSQQLKRGKGNIYSHLCPTICIMFLNYTEFPDTPNKLHSVFELRERSLNSILMENHMELHFIELPKVYNTRLLSQESAKEIDLIYWSKFFTCETEEELEELAMTNTTIKQAKSALSNISTKTSNRYAAESRKKALLDYKSSMNDAQLAGWAEGMEKGMEKGKFEANKALVIKLYNNKIDASQIALLVDLSLETIQEIITETKNK